MHFALVWVSATITAVIAAERTQNSANKQTAPFALLGLICAGEGAKRRRGGQQHHQVQVSRKLLRKGRVNVRVGRSDSRSHHRLNQGVFQEQAEKEGMEIRRSISPSAEHHWLFDRHGQYRSSDTDKGGLSVQHVQLPLGNGRHPLDSLQTSDELLQNVGKDTSAYSAKWESIGNIEANSSQSKSAPFTAQQHPPQKRPDHPEEDYHMQTQLYQQRLHPKESRNSMGFQRTPGPGNREHRKSMVRTNEIETLAHYNQASPSQRYSILESNDMSRKKRAESTLRNAVQPDAELHMSSEVPFQLARRNDPKNHQYQEQREVHQQNRYVLHASQEKRESVPIQRLKTEGIRGFSVEYESLPEVERLPPVRLPFPFVEGGYLHRGSGMPSAFSGKVKSITGRRKPPAAKDNLAGIIGFSKEKRAERRSYRKGDNGSTVGSAVSASIRGRDSLSDEERNRTFFQNVPISGLSLADFELDMAGELPPMSKSVLDLGVGDLQMLAEILYELKSAHYTERLEEASKQREVQEGMFFTRLKRIQERQKRQRREREVENEERLKSLEATLRLTKPFNAYLDTLSGKPTHKHKRKSISAMRPHKDSELKGGNRITGEAPRRSPRKKEDWWERKQKQMIALALIESEEPGEKGSGRRSRLRRHSKRGGEEKDTDDGASFYVEHGNQVHEPRPLFSSWQDLSMTPDSRGDPLFAAEKAGLPDSSQVELKRKIRPDRTGNTGGNPLDKKPKETEDATEEADGPPQPFSQHENSPAQGPPRGVQTHLEALSRPIIGLQKNYTLAGKAKSEEVPEGLTQGQGQADQRIGMEMDTSSLFPPDGETTLSGLLLDEEFFPPSNVGVAASGEEGAPDTEFLSAVVGGDGTQKLLREKVSEKDQRVQEKNWTRKRAALSLGDGAADTSAGKSRVHEDSEEAREGESVAAEADMSGLQQSGYTSTLLSDSAPSGVGKPQSENGYETEQEEGWEGGDEVDFLLEKHAHTGDKTKPPEAYDVKRKKGADAEETYMEFEPTAGIQSQDVIGEAGMPEEEAAEVSVEGVAESEASSRSVATADGPEKPTEVPEKDVLFEEPGLKYTLPEDLETDTVGSSAIQSQFRESPHRSGDHRLKGTLAPLERFQDIKKEDTFTGEEFLKKDLPREELVLDDTYASGVDEGSPPEALKNDKKLTTFSRQFKHTTDTSSVSPLEILSISPSRLTRFRTRHFGSDTLGKSEVAGQRTERFVNRGPESKQGDKVKPALPVRQDQRASPYYRRLQFTSKKKTVVDRNTPARFEFVDNDHGMQFVNWRSFDGERMIEKFWVNSMQEAERQQRKQVQRDIESAFAKEFDAVRREKQLLHALGVATAEQDENEQQLAQRYYSAMQAVLHGPEEEVLTGQAFGRYVPNANQSFLTDIRNRIIYGPWSVNWNRAITSRTQRVSVGSRRGAVSVGSSASSYVTTANVNWGRTAVTFAARPNDQAVKLGVLRGRYGVDIARSNRLRTSAVETVMRYVESATVVDQINRTYGQRVRVRRFSFNYTRDFTLPGFDSPGRTPGLRQELGVNWGSVGISVGTDVPDSEYAVSVGLRGYQFSVLRDFFQRLVQAQGNWGRGWQFELAAKIEDPISALIYYQFGFGRLGRLYATAGAGIGGDSTPMVLFQVQGDRSSVAFKALEAAGVRIFNVGITVGRFTYSWDSVVDYQLITLPLSPIHPVLKALLHVLP